MNTHGTPETKLYTYLLIVGAYLALVLILLRIIPRFAILMALVGVIVGLGVLMALVRQKWTSKKEERKASNSFDGRIQLRLVECRQKEEQFRSEVEEVRNSIKTLQDDLDRSNKADETEQERARELIKEFQAEFNLRHTKAAFFADCVTKLEELLARHQLHQSITARRRELEELRKTNFDDEARIEETRYHLEQDTTQLDTIAELSKGISVSFKAEQAEELRARLEKIRTSL
ncbi:MAG: hypothetical protein ACJAZ9_001761 [Neolewinella sp.]|jgi:hypothetical protein